MTDLRPRWNSFWSSLSTKLAPFVDFRCFAPPFSNDELPGFADGIEYTVPRFRYWKFGFRCRIYPVGEDGVYVIETRVSVAPPHVGQNFRVGSLQSLCEHPLNEQIKKGAPPLAIEKKKKKKEASQVNMRCLLETAVAT
jgi:hypothetical protein